jgi:hypothetical protein
MANGSGDATKASAAQVDGVALLHPFSSFDGLATA